MTSVHQRDKRNVILQLGQLVEYLIVNSNSPYWHYIIIIIMAGENSLNSRQAKMFPNDTIRELR